MKKYKNNLVLFTLLSLVVISCRSTKIGEVAKIKQPNILLLLSDDQSFNTINALGNKEVSTPNMDRLVSEGTTFTHAHIMGGNTGAICMPSRAMMMTGKNVHRFNSKGALTSEDETIPQLLREAGYATFGTGKWHNNNDSFAKSFTHGSNIFLGGMSNHLRVPLHDFDPSGEYPKRNRRFEDKFSSVLFREATVDFLENYNEEKPFFAFVSFTSPHDPRMAPKEYEEMFNTEKISLPENFQPIHPFDNGELIIRDENLLPFPRTEEAVLGELASYYAMISEVDDNIGKILDALKKSEKYDNTIIIFASDNGLAVGQHGLIGKQNLYDHSIRVPLIISGPGIKKGVRTESLVYLHDLFPTIADLVGIETPTNIDAKSLKPILDNPNETVRENVFYLYKNFQRGVRTKDFKLIKYLVEGWQTTQLFDIKNDPLEMNNLVYDPKYADELEQMTALLQECINESGDKVNLDQSDWGVNVIKSWVTKRKEKGLSLDYTGKDL